MAKSFFFFYQNGYSILCFETGQNDKMSKYASGNCKSGESWLGKLKEK
jgi:hypothetical protein